MAMAAQLTPHWKLPSLQSSTATPSINTTNIRPVLRPKPLQEEQEHQQKEDASGKDSFLEIRKKLEQSRKSFLNSQHKEEPPLLIIKESNGYHTTTPYNDLEKINNSTKKSLVPEDSQLLNSKRPTKKISFKIRKNASIYRRKAPEVKAVNLVQELTKKYNELDEQRQALPSVEKSKIVKRNNSNALRRRNSCKAPVEKDNLTSVKAAILIFEQKCTAPSTAKPQVPAKTFNVQEVAIRNQEKRMKLRQQQQQQQMVMQPHNQQEQKQIEQDKEKKQQEQTEIPRCNNNDIVRLCNRQDNGNYLGEATAEEKEMDRCNEVSCDRVGDVEALKMDAGVIGPDELQVVSLPMGVVKRCESNYEWQKFGQYGKCTLKPGTKTASLVKPSETSALLDDGILDNNVQMEEKSLLRTPPRRSHQKISNNWLKTTIPDTRTYFLDPEDGAWVAVDLESRNSSNLSHKPVTSDDDYDIVLPPADDPEIMVPSIENKQDFCPPLPPRGKFKEHQGTKKVLTTDDDYEIPEVPPDSPTLVVKEEENIYESLSRCSRRSSTERTHPPTTGTMKSQCGTMSKDQREPLPPRPSSSSSSVDYNDESNYYESIYSKRDDSYESIYGGSRVLGVSTKRHSISVQSVQSDQQSNSIYGRSITSWAEEVLETYIGGSSGSGSLASAGGRGSGCGKAVSELSGSSDDWVDISDHENEDASGKGNNLVKFVIVREARHQKVTKKNSGWSQRIRGQWNKVPKKMDQNGDSDSDHTYETLYNNNGMPLGPTDQQLAQQNQQQKQEIPPRIQLHSHHQDAEDDEDFDSFESGSESDNSFAKNDSGVDMGNTQLPDPPANQQTYAFTRFAASAGKNVMKRLRRNWSMRKNDISKSLSRITKRKSRTDLDTIETEASPPSPALQLPLDDKAKSLARRGFLNKFKRSMSMTGDIGDHFSDRPKSTFYITEDLDIEDAEEAMESSKSPNPPKLLVRPQMPPPPTPTQKSRSQSWYAESGVFKPEQNAPTLPRRPNSFWYAEVGLYQSGSPASTASASSSENSGNSGHSGHSTNSNINEDYYQKNYYNTSVKSYDSTDTKKDEAFNSLQGDIQLRLQDEPLYQFYDAAVLESVCASGLSDFYDDYEEIAKEKRNMSGRPTAMELVSPQRNNVSVARTLWCEIPEVVQSTVLSTLSMHQKKLQEAKFEMLTSEASYLNSLHVLTEHFVKKLKESDLLNEFDKEVLCSKILPVKECSGRLLLDLEKCWQENILLHGVCDIVKSHAEESFGVYVAYCENQIILDQTLKRLKEKPLFVEFLRQLEANSICQLLTLYSFLMLPMQRITRWPLLIDAILKRLSPQDDEYQSCQYALATLNKIVTQCNEGARNMERITEMKKLASQMEFARGVPPIELVNGRRWLVRSGQLTQMVNRGDDVKLTFGKRFTKIPVHLFLFNDIIIVAKSKSEGVFLVQHYCSRSYLELNSESLATLPTKDTQGRHLIFLTILENHEQRTVEMLLACSSESDRERWLEALTPPKSENPDETLYECWDCPQVTAVHNYTANQPDELPLTRGDVINVTRKMADGWYHGERMRDGETGWFPANYTVEVANPHVRARNLKQRYRLLAYSENYLKSK